MFYLRYICYIVNECMLSHIVLNTSNLTVINTLNLKVINTLYLTVINTLNE